LEFVAFEGSMKYPGEDVQQAGECMYRLKLRREG
jgi:hypothetical protein